MHSRSAWYPVTAALLVAPPCSAQTRSGSPDTVDVKVGSPLVDFSGHKLGAQRAVSTVTRNGQTRSMPPLVWTFRLDETGGKPRLLVRGTPETPPSAGGPMTAPPTTTVLDRTSLAFLQLLAEDGLVALGHSGGAVLAAHLGTVDDPRLYLQSCPWPVPRTTWLRGVVTIAGIFDYRREGDFAPAHNSFTPRYFGGSQAERPAVWAEASPIDRVDGSEPPFLILHGASDEMVRPAHSARAADIMKRAGVDVEYVEIPAADHNTVLNPATFGIVERFLRRRLANGGIDPTVHGRGTGLTP